MASSELRAALRKPFSPTEVKQRQGPGGTKLDYVAGETLIGRLLEATADYKDANGVERGYAWQAHIQTLERIVTPEYDTDIETGVQTQTGETSTYLAVVEGNLLIDGDMGTGVGAMRNPDPDMAVKSANTEALKNAAKNGFGIGLELWDKEYRAGLDQRRRAAGGSEQALKTLVWERAKTKLNSKAPSTAQVAELFNVEAGSLADADTLAEILAAEGVL